LKPFGYLPHTETERKEMLAFLGLQQTEGLFDQIPAEIRLKEPIQIPQAWSELELTRQFGRMAARNKNTEEYVSFLGAGAYEHAIPAVVEAIVGRSEFYTAYTPYQPEISQGILQAIFEYQTMICELTGMEVSNASLYDGPTAMAEAGMMACAATKRTKLLVSRAVHPEYREVLKTYAYGQRLEIVEIGMGDGLTDLDELGDRMGDDIAGCIVQYPNFFGCVEPLEELAALTRHCGALFIAVVNPIAMGILEPPGSFGADIVVAEGQPLGNPLSFGGPYLGILATTRALVRRMPGRIIGQTTDLDGRRAFVLTLQAREQHIRREKATSNVCSNQALNALAATVYLSYMGKQGLCEVARQCMLKTQYAIERLTSIKGVERLFSTAVFHECAFKLPASPAAVNKKLLEHGIIGGYELAKDYPRYENSVLLAFTEARTKEEIDTLAERLEAVL
jgi:glycine dehydrogenase subunit 1